MNRWIRNVVCVFGWVVLASAIVSCAGGADCGPGTVMNPDTGNCDAVIAECGPGTQFAQETGRCESLCGRGTYWDGVACQTVPSCAEGTAFNPETGFCEPSERCGEGTRNIHGECIPYTLPEADVKEDELYSKQFQLPAEGGVISLGGTIGTPEDYNGDGTLDADWDSFVFSTRRTGVLLRIRAISSGACQPAFSFVGVDPSSMGSDPTQWAVFLFREALNPNGIETKREVYLPRGGYYFIQVTDYTNMVNMVDKTVDMPVGGENFQYYITVEHLPAPNPQALETLPFSLVDQFRDGGLRFFLLKNLLAGDVIGFFSEPSRLGLASSDVLPALMVFAPDGSWIKTADAVTEIEKKENGKGEVGRAEVFLRSEGGGDYLVVQDFVRITGPRTGFGLSIDPKEVSDVTGSTHQGGQLSAQGDTLYGWRMSPGDFLDVGVKPQQGFSDIVLSLLDDDMDVFSKIDARGQGNNEMAAVYTDAESNFYLRVTEKSGQATTFSMDFVQIATPELQSGTGALSLRVTDMPEGTLQDMGVDHFAGAKDQMAFFLGFTVHNPTSAWNNPFESIADRNINGIGPALESSTLQALFPVFGYLRDDAQYLHMAFDADPKAKIQNATYDVTLYLQNVLALGKPTLATPVGATSVKRDGSTGAALFSLDLDASQGVEIVVTPSQGSSILPEVSLLNFGDVACFVIWCWWAPATDGPRLGRVAMGSASAAGEGVSVSYLSPYAGRMVLMVRDAGLLGQATDAVDIHVQMASPPANDLCANAQDVVPDQNGFAVMDGTLFGAANDADLGPNNSCTGEFGAPGPDVFYRIVLAEGDLLDVAMDAPFDSVLYLIRQCDNPRANCVVGADANQSGVERFAYRIPQGAGGPYWIVADSYSGAGSFKLSVSVAGLPQNNACSEAEPIILDITRHASLTASTAMAVNTLDLGSGNGCTGSKSDGPELFYRIDLQAGETIHLVLTPQNSEYDSSLYILSSCFDPVSHCVAGMDQKGAGQPESLSYNVLETGTYIIVSDAYRGSGLFQLDVSVEPTP
jgi:hypothetical protein